MEAIWVVEDKRNNTIASKMKALSEYYFLICNNEKNGKDRN